MDARLTQKMRTATFVFAGAALTTAFSQLAMAANIFVTPAKGPNLMRSQADRITSLVRRSVENMPEHKLVRSESEADFVLRPSVVRRENGPVLRVEKAKESELVAVAEQPIDITSGVSNAQAVTQRALQLDSYVGTSAMATAAPQQQPATYGPQSYTASRNPAASDESLSGSTSPAGDIPAASDSGDSRSIHNTQPTTAALVENPSMSESMGTSEQSTGSAAIPPSSVDQQNFAQDHDTGDLSSQSSGQQEVVIPESAPQRSVSSEPSSKESSQSSSSGELRGPSPRLANQKMPGFFQMGFGPSFAIGLNSDNIMYNINGAYNYNIDEQWAVKGFGDFNIGTGADSAQFVNLGVAGELYPQNWPSFGGAKPYVQADLGYAFARSSRNLITNSVSTGDGVSIGAGAGFKFEAAELNWDITAHYALLTSQIDQRTPSVLGIRAALNF